MESYSGITMQINDKKIKVTEQVVQVMSQHCQLDFLSKEAGGIIIGRENIENGNLIIEYITQPYKKDKRTRYSFYRKDARHINFYNELYQKYNGIYAYVGEWHTHPEDYPNYSGVDIKNWKEIAQSNSDKDKKYYHFIIGRKEIRIWEYCGISNIANRVY